MTQHGSVDIGSWLVRLAARSAAPDLASRLEEEWLADLSTRRGLASRICFGLGCCWAGRVIAREHAVACAATAPAASAAGPASGHRLLLTDIHFDPSRWSRGTTAIVGIVCVHALLIYAFVTGLAQRVVANIPFSLDGGVIVQPQAHLQPPPLPQPRLAQPRWIESPVAPLTPIVTDEPDSSIHVVPPPQHPTPAAQLSRPKAVNRIVGGPGAGFPDTEDFYPPVSRRLEQVGTSLVEVCVDPRGVLTAVPTIVGSSGHPALDQGALKLARAGSGRYRATTENGQPVSSCYAFRVTFRLKD